MLLTDQDYYMAINVTDTENSINTIVSGGLRKWPFDFDVRVSALDTKFYLFQDDAVAVDVPANLKACTDQCLVGSIKWYFWSKYILEFLIIVCNILSSNCCLYADMFYKNVGMLSS